MRKMNLLGLLLISTVSFAQFPGFIGAQEFSKDVSLYRAKSFLIHDVLKTSENSIRFEATSLAAATSGELTTLLYKCDSQEADGLILGFYGNYWDSKTGVSYQGYAFKNFPKDKAYRFLEKIESEIEKNKKFLKENNINNNITFNFDDLKIIIYTATLEYTIRVFWNGFDSSWERSSFAKSKRRFERKI